MDRNAARERQTASEGLMAPLKLWKTGHKTEETPIKDGDSGAGKGEDTSKMRLIPLPQHDL